MSTNNEETLRQFCDVTGAEEARSRFFLESSNWQLEVALSSFYEHGGNADEAPAPHNPLPTSASLPTLSDSDMESPPGSPIQPQKKDKKKTNTKFATLDSLHQKSSSDEEEDVQSKRRKDMRKFFGTFTSCSEKQNIEAKLNLNDIPTTSKNLMESKETEDVEKLRVTIERLTRENSELKREIARLKGMNTSVYDKGQAFYAGGSERSGQQILGPGKGRKDIVAEMFKSVRERGAVVFEDEPATGSRGRGGGAFSGVGYRLGQTSDDHEQVTPQNAAGQQQEQARSVRLRLYREGFTVDNGALRQYSDPENAEFLSCIRRGEIPPELSGGGGEVRVSLEDRRLEECPRQGSVKSQAFTGKGQMLGSPAPATVGVTAPVATDASDRAANQRAAQAALKLNEADPTTTIQFRLADGSRITGRFNHTHTVSDLHQYISLAEPAYQLVPFTLVTTFPSAELTDPKVTLADAKLLNSTLLQRLK